MILNVDLVGDKELVATLDRMPQRVHAALVAKVTALAFKLEAKVKTQKLSGQVLKVRSGALRRSIASDVDQRIDKVTGRVFSGGDVKYAGIHEFGGVIKHPGGTKYRWDKKAGRIVFIPNKSEMAAWAFPVTKPHDIPMPQRSFLRSSLGEMAAENGQQLEDAVKSVVKDSVKK